MQKFKFYSSAVLMAILVLCAVSCQQTQPKQVASTPAVHDTIVVHDTVKVSDESDIESIKYYKRLSEQLWRGIELVQKNTPESDAELADLNKQILSAREKHNQSVTEATITAIKRVVSAK